MIIHKQAFNIGLELIELSLVFLIVFGVIIGGSLGFFTVLGSILQ